MGSIEIFKVIKPFPMYEVSSSGKVRNIKTKRYLKPRFNTSGYLRVNLYKEGRPHDIEVHILVARAFFEINHKDDDKTNNAVSNFEFISHAKNMKHAGKTGLMKSKIPFAERSKIKRLSKTKSIYAIAKLYGVKYDTIKNILRRLT
jgi:hypothetical protein